MRLAWIRVPCLVGLLLGGGTGGQADTGRSGFGRAIAKGQTVRTDQIIQSTVIQAASCRAVPIPLGVCYWLVCVGPYCTTKTSTKWGHYNPDLVLGSMNGIGQNPWDLARKLHEKIEENTVSALTNNIARVINGGVRSEGHPGRAEHTFPNHANLLFRDVDAIGHPVSGSLQCPSEAEAFEPYYLSAVDVLAWRWAIPETIYPQSVVPGLRELGSWPLNTWGAIYPRTGWAIQAEEPKAAALTVQRAGDFITRNGEPHVYQELKSDGITTKKKRNKTYLLWRPKPLQELDDKTGMFQMISPVMGRCETFGANDTVSTNGWGGGKVAADGSYLFALWRPYSCCEAKGIFLFDIAVPFP